MQHLIVLNAGQEEEVITVPMPPEIRFLGQICTNCVPSLMELALRVLFKALHNSGENNVPKRSVKRTSPFFHKFCLSNWRDENKNLKCRILFKCSLDFVLNLFTGYHKIQSDPKLLGIKLTVCALLDQYLAVFKDWLHTSVLLHYPTIACNALVFTSCDVVGWIHFPNESQKQPLLSFCFKVPWDLFHAWPETHIWKGLCPHSGMRH